MECLFNFWTAWCIIMKTPRLTDRGFSSAESGSEFIALLLRNPAKIYRMESEYTEQHRRSPVVGLLTTSDAEKYSKAPRQREPRRVRFNKKWWQISNKYAFRFHSNLHQRTGKHFKHQSIYPQQYCMEGKIYIRSQVASWWLLGCILGVLFATSALTSSLTFRFSIFFMFSHTDCYLRGVIWDVGITYEDLGK